MACQTWLGMERKERKKGSKFWQRSRRRSDKDAEEGPKIVAKSSPNPSKIMLLAALGCSWGVLGRLGPVLGHLGVILGRSWGGLGAWGQDDPRWGLGGHLEANWGTILGTFGGLGGDLCKKSRSVKTTNPPSLLVLFEVSGVSLEALVGYLGRSWPQVGRSWRPCWAMLAHLGEKMGYVRPSWRYVAPSWRQDAT